MAWHAGMQHVARLRTADARASDKALDGVETSAEGALHTHTEGVGILSMKRCCKLVNACRTFMLLHHMPDILLCDALSSIPIVSVR